MIEKRRFERTAPLIFATAAGLTGTVGQILILRELLVLFTGNELSSGLFFACWLVWTALGSGGAGFLARRNRPVGKWLPWVLLAAAAALPTSLLFIRAARLMGSIPSGEMLSLPLMILFTSFATFPSCVCLGALFSIAWSLHADQVASSSGLRPVRVYLCEALGAAAGCGIFHFLLLPEIHALGTALTLAGVLTGLAAAYPLCHRMEAPPPYGLTAVWVLAVLGLVAAAANVEGLEAQSRQWQWGKRIVATRDTPYQHLTVLQEAGLFSFFGSGSWLFSTPDRYAAESASHPAMLQHPRPRSVLSIGGAASGLVDEILKYPDIQTVVVIEPDPELIRLARRLLPGELTAGLEDPRVHVAYEDAGSFLRRKEGAYDVILLNVGEPVSIQMNRFFTVEHFRLLKDHLTTDGLLSFSVSVAPEMLGQAQARLIGSLNATLRAVFPRVRLVMGGEGARFMAGLAEGALETDAIALSSRAQRYGLSLQYVNDAALQDLFSPFRARYVEALLEEQGTPPANEDFRPVSALQTLLVWSAQIHPGLEHVLLRITSGGPAGLWGAIITLGAGFFVVALGCRKRWGRSPGIALSVGAVGASQMVLQLCLLLGFQILEGYLYLELALIVGAFMVGIGAGSAVVDFLAARVRHPRRFLLLTQGGLMAHFAGSILMLLRFHSHQPVGSGAELKWIFPSLALMAGTLGGLHYCLAVRTLSVERGTAPGAWEGGGLYALDLLGAALGAMSVSLILLPVYGLITTCLAALAVLGVSLAILMIP